MICSIEFKVLVFRIWGSMKLKITEASLALGRALRSDGLLAFVTRGLEGRGHVQDRPRWLLLSCPEVWVGGSWALAHRARGAQQPW